MSLLPSPPPPSLPPLPPGCTHMNDPTHRERFWHPPVPPLSADQLRTHYICNECGIATTSLPDLQVR